MKKNWLTMMVVCAISENSKKGIDIMLEPEFDVDISDDSYDSLYSEPDAGKWMTKEELGVAE